MEEVEDAVHGWMGTCQSYPVNRNRNCLDAIAAAAAVVGDGKRRVVVDEARRRSPQDSSCFRCGAGGGGGAVGDADDCADACKCR